MPGNQTSARIPVPQEGGDLVVYVARGRTVAYFAITGGPACLSLDLDHDHRVRCHLGHRHSPPLENCSGRIPPARVCRVHDVVFDESCPRCATESAMPSGP